MAAVKIPESLTPSPYAASSSPADDRGRHVTIRRRIRRRFCHRYCRLILLACCIALRLAKIIGRRPRVTTEPRTILLTGRFDSLNWGRWHLRPLASSTWCSKVYVVAAGPVPEIPNLVRLPVPNWLTRLIGNTPARLITFCLWAIRLRPHLVGGFHLVPNAITAAFIARLIGSRSLYFCVGGPEELLDGGIWQDSGPLSRMETPDAVVERRLLKCVGASNLIVTMGSRAVEFFRWKGIDASFHVISGGVDSEAFAPTSEKASIDLLFVGRLAAVKDPGLFLRVVQEVRRHVPTATAAVIGEGPLRPQMEQLAKELGLAESVRFVGYQENVGQWLRQGRVLVLTSWSEGLSLAVMEAMMSGLPAVVSAVGDLGDLIRDGVSGYLVKGRRPCDFAERIVSLLTDGPRYAMFSREARTAALNYDQWSAKRKWDAALFEL